MLSEHVKNWRLVFILIPIILLAFVNGCALPGTNSDDGKGTLEESNVQDQAPIEDLQKSIGGLTIKAVACGYTHSLAITSDGALWVTGSNLFGELGLGDDYPYYNCINWTKTDLKNVTLIAAGQYHSLCVSSGILHVTGYNGYGQLGLGDTQSRRAWVRTLYGNIQKISCGSYYSMFTSWGTLWVTGQNSYGQLGLSDNNNRYTWQRTFYGNIQAIACGFFHSMFTSGGKLWVTGLNSNGQLGLGDVYNRNTWTQTKHFNIQNIAAGGYHSIFVSIPNPRTKNELWVTGLNSSGQLGMNDKWMRASWQRSIYGDIQKISCGFQHSMFTSRNNLWVAGNNTSGQLGLNDNNERIAFTPTIYGDVDNIAAGGHHSIFTSFGNLWVTGWNDDYGQLGTGNYNNLKKFTQLY